MDSGNKISGKVVLNGASSSAVSSKSIQSFCTSPTVFLYGIDDAGNRLSTPLAQSQVDSDGEFTLIPTGGESISLEDGIQYILEVVGCTESLSRFVTGKESQDITLGSTLLAYSVGSSYGSLLKNVELDNMKSLVDSLSSSLDFSSAYSSLVGDAEKEQIFRSIFNAAPSILLNIPPKLLFENVTTSLPEDTSQSFSTAFAHWSPNYEKAYLW